MLGKALGEFRYRPISLKCCPTFDRKRAIHLRRRRENPLTLQTFGEKPFVQTVIGSALWVRNQ